METNEIKPEETTAVTDEPKFFKDINAVVNDNEEDLIDNMPDTHPSPKPAGTIS